MDNQNLFGQTYDEIVKSILGGGTPNFQMLGNPISFNWPVAPNGQLSRQAYQLMSASPAYSPIGDFSGIGTSSLFSNYREVFQHIGFKLSPEQAKQVQDLSDQATAARNKIGASNAGANTDYNTQKQNGGAIFEAQYPTIQDWLAGPGASYKIEVDTLQKQVAGIFLQIQALNSAQQPSSLQEALDAVKLPSGAPSGGNSPRGWTVVPNGAGVLEWQPDFTIATTSQDWRNQLTSGSVGAKSISLSAAKSNSSIDKTWAGASVSYGTPFWGAYASGKWENTDITASDSSVEATVSVEGSTLVQIQPGAWYDGGFLKNIVTSGNNGTGYNVLSPYTVSGPDHALFGKDGLCSTMITGLVVAYKPSFSVTMASSTYKSHETSIEASAGFRIGPFTFGGSGGHYEKQVATTGNRTTLTGGSTSSDPVIIGVTVGFPGTEKP